MLTFISDKTIEEEVEVWTFSSLGPVQSLLDFRHRSVSGIRCYASWLCQPDCSKEVCWSRVMAEQDFSSWDIGTETVRTSIQESEINTTHFLMCTLVSTIVVCNRTHCTCSSARTDGSPP